MFRRELWKRGPSSVLVIGNGTQYLQCWSLANHAVYMLIQYTPLLVEKAGVARVVTFRIIVRKQERVQARYPLWIWNPWGRTHKVQNRSNQWLHKMDLGPNKNLKKKDYSAVILRAYLHLGKAGAKVTKTVFPDAGKFKYRVGLVQYPIRVGSVVNKGLCREEQNKFSKEFV